MKSSSRDVVLCTLSYNIIVIIANVIINKNQSIVPCKCVGLIDRVMLYSVG